jgi:hypothetical protein
VRRGLGCYPDLYKGYSTLPQTFTLKMEIAMCAEMLGPSTTEVDYPQKLKLYIKLQL